MSKRLFGKYIVKKAFGKSDPKAEYFVLRIDKDPHARVALLAYAQSIINKEPDFAVQLMDWVKRFEDKP